MVIKATYYDVQDIGKHVKKSKRRFIWRFSIDGKEHTIEMLVSYLSGKKKVTHNGGILYEGQKMMSTSFQFPFSIGTNMCNIVQHGEQFELRINNQVFDHLYNQEKMKREFAYEESGSYQKGDDDEQYAGYDNKNSRNDTYDNYPKSSREKSTYEGYGNKSSNEGYGNRSSNEGYGKSSYEGYGKSSYEGYGGSANDGGNRSSYRNDYGSKKREESPQNYSKSKGWDDVKRAQKAVKAFKTSAGGQDVDQDQKVNEPEEDGLGFDHGFNKFDYGKSQTRQPTNNNRRSVDDDAFESHQNKYSNDQPVQRSKTIFDNPTREQERPKKSSSPFENFSTTQPTANKEKDPFDFSSFGNFTQEQPKKNDFGFGNFKGFDEAPAPSKTNNSAQQENPKAGLDLFSLDFSTTTQANQANTNNNTGSLFGAQPQPQMNSNNPNNNGGSFFGSTNSGFGQVPQQTNNVPQKKPTNDLLDLDFSSGSQPSQQQSSQIGTNQSQFGQNMGVVQQPSSQPQNNQNQPFMNNQQKSSTQPGAFDLLGGDNNTQQQSKQTQPNKPKNLWDTDLVSLDSKEALQQPKPNQGMGSMGGYQPNSGMGGYGQGSFNIYSGGMGGFNNMGGGYGNNMGYGGNMGGNGNNNMGGMGGYGNNSNLGGGYGSFNTSVGGYGGYTNNPGFGNNFNTMNQGNANQGWGGNNGFSGMSNNSFGMGQNNFGGNQFGGNKQQPVAQTPFDF